MRTGGGIVIIKNWRVWSRAGRYQPRSCSHERQERRKGCILSLSKKGCQYYSSRKVNSKCFRLGNISPDSISPNRGRSSRETDVRAKLSIVSQRKGAR